ncbi:hypothetical protein [Streptomyces cellulosae]|uniref:hypothetical protein n=1 Tax=Streptomyces cellulosae TaxID=1968 RepID=UPI0004C598F8|nr:hypothetical protein [Streptomyces cellulosae]
MWADAGKGAARRTRADSRPGHDDDVRRRRIHAVYGGGRPDWFVWEFWAQTLPGELAPDIQREQLKTHAEQIMPAFRDTVSSTFTDKE